MIVAEKQSRREVEPGWSYESNVTIYFQILVLRYEYDGVHQAIQNFIVYFAIVTFELTTILPGVGGSQIPCIFLRSKEGRPFAPG